MKLKFNMTIVDGAFGFFKIRNMHMQRNVYTNINKVGFLSFMKDKEYDLCNNIGTTCSKDKQ